MSEYNKAITELQKKINDRDREIHETKIKIGNELSRLKPENIKNTPLFEGFQKVQELKKVIPVKKKTIQDIKKLDNEIEGLNHKITEIKTLLTEHEKEYKTIYENIGSAAYTAFKLNREKLVTYEDNFIALINQDSKCERFNRVDVSGNPDEKNIIKQFVDAAKSMYRNQKHKFILFRYPGLYRQAGKAILTTDFVDDAAYGPLDEAMKPLIENEKTILQLHNDMNKLNKEKDGCLKKLTSLEVKGRPGKKIQEIGEEIQQMEEMLNGNYDTMAGLFLEHNLIKEVDNEKILDCMHSIDALENENRSSEEEIKKYETLIAIEKVDHKLIKTTNKIDHLKNLIEKQEKELASLQKVHASLEKQKKDLEKNLTPVVSKH